MHANRIYSGRGRRGTVEGNADERPQKLLEPGWGRDMTWLGSVFLDEARQGGGAADEPRFCNRFAWSASFLGSS